MKTLTHMIIALCSIATEGAIGQSDKTGVFNSANDYKHPYKTSKNNAYNVNYIKPTEGAGNYKQQNKNVATRAEGVIITQDKKEELQNWNALTNPGNYKTHH